MRRRLAVGFCLTLVLSVISQGCSNAAATPAVDRPPAVTASPAELAFAESANGDFAVDLYQQLAKENPNQNLFFSPFSVSSALLIAAEGASGETADQMGKVLHVPKSLRNSGPDAASLPWQLTDLHKGQAAIYYRLSPEPISPELSAKIAKLRSDLDAANHETARLQTSDNWQKAEASNAAAEKLAGELNPLLAQTEPYEWRTANAILGREDLSVPPVVSRHDSQVLRQRGDAGRFPRQCGGVAEADQRLGRRADARPDQRPHALRLDRQADAAGHHQRRLFQRRMAAAVQRRLDATQGFSSAGRQDFFHADDVEIHVRLRRLRRLQRRRHAVQHAP